MKKFLCILILTITIITCFRMAYFGPNYPKFDIHGVLPILNEIDAVTPIVDEFMTFGYNLSTIVNDLSDKFSGILTNSLPTDYDNVFEFTIKYLSNLVKQFLSSIFSFFGALITIILLVLSIIIDIVLFILFSLYDILRVFIYILLNEILPTIGKQSFVSNFVIQYIYPVLT